jgi:hypothetical protein
METLTQNKRIRYPLQIKPTFQINKTYSRKKRALVLVHRLRQSHQFSLQKTPKQLFHTPGLRLNEVFLF